MSVHFHPSHSSGSNTIDDNDLVSGLLRRNTLCLFRENYHDSARLARYVLTNSDNQALAYIVPDYSHKVKDNMPPRHFQLQDTVGRLLLVVHKHMTGTTSVSIPSRDRVGGMRYLGCTVPSPNHQELKAFLPTSGHSLATFAHVRNTNGQLQFVDPLGRTGAQVTAVPYQTLNELGQIVDVKGKSVPNSYRIVMTTSNLKGDRNGRVTATAGNFAMGITQRAIVLAQIMSMDLDGFVLQSTSRQPGRSGLLDPNAVIAPKQPVYQSLPLGQAGLVSSMTSFLPYPNVNIAPYDPYHPHHSNNNIPVYIDGMLHYVASPPH